MEVWKDIPGYEGYYQISDKGHVRTLARYTHVLGVCRNDGKIHNEMWFRRSRLLKPIYVRRSNSPYVHLYKDGQARVSVSIKRLVAQAFLSDFKEDIPTNAIKLHDPAGPLSVENLYIQTSNKSKKSIPDSL